MEIAIEHPAIIRQIPIALISIPKVFLRFFNITSIFFPINLQLTKSKTPPFFPILLFKIPIKSFIARINISNPDFSTSKKDSYSVANVQLIL